MGPFFPKELTTFMTRTFRHEFDPAEEDPIAGQDDVELTVQEIEDAGLHEVLQTPGAALGSWATPDNADSRRRLFASGHMRTSRFDFLASPLALLHPLRSADSSLLSRARPGSVPEDVRVHALDDEAGGVAGRGGVRLSIELGRRQILSAVERQFAVAPQAARGGGEPLEVAR